MSGQRLVIEADDLGRFFLALQDGTLSLDNGQGIMRNLHVGRIRCEVEVEASVIVLNGPAGERELHPGQTVQVGHSTVSFLGKSSSPPSTAPAPGGLVRRLVVIDGADHGQAFAVPATGLLAIGNNPKHAAVVLRDPTVARVHCELHVEGDRITVTHRESARGTIVNGQRVSVQPLHLGDVIRLGNTQLRFELGSADAVAEQPAGAPAPPAARVSPNDPLLKLENQPLGNYQLGPSIGPGRTGMSFLATHRQTDQSVSLKVFPAEYPQGDELQSFVRTLKVIAPLRHPHLVPILAGGKSGAHYWIAREYVAGENVAALIDRQNAEGERDWKVACRVAVHLGKVLDYLEQHKVRHARLTLPNILIESASEMTRLADVMPEKVLDAPRPGEDARERQLAEAPFRAPEETLDAGSVDHRASLYTVGAVAYALLTGKPPYAGVSVVAIATQARDGKVVRPTKLAPDTPAPFEAAVLKLLAGRPDERYQSAADLLEVVEPIASMHEIRV